MAHLQQKKCFRCYRLLQPICFIISRSAYPLVVTQHTPTLTYSNDCLPCPPLYCRLTFMLSIWAQAFSPPSTSPKPRRQADTLGYAHKLARQQNSITLWSVPFTLLTLKIFHVHSQQQAALEHQWWQQSRSWETEGGRDPSTMAHTRSYFFLLQFLYPSP